MMSSIKPSPQQIAEAWRRGRLKYKFWNNIQRKIDAKFEDCLRRKTGILFVNCTRGGGKTNWGCTKALEYIRNPRIKKPQVFLATAFAEDLRTIIAPTFESIMDDKPTQLPIISKPSLKLYLDAKSKGVIHYRGLDLKKNSLRGNYADLVIIEECQNVKSLAYQWNYVVKQLFRHRPFPICVFIGTPPETPDHDWVELMEIAKLNDAYVEATIDEHDMMDDEEKAFLMKDLDEDAIQREFYCKLVIDKTRAVIPEWDAKYEKVVEPDKFRPYYHNYNTMDLGVKHDFTAGLSGYYDFLRATFVVTHEFGMKGAEMTTDKVAAAVRAQNEAAFGKWSVYKSISDNNNPLLIQDLNIIHGLPFLATDKSFLKSMVNHLRMWIKAGRVEIDPSCKMTLGCVRSGVWDKHRKEFAKSKIYGHYDWLAALVYLIRNIDESINPIPPYLGANLASPSVVVIPGQNKAVLKQFGE